MSVRPRQGHPRPFGLTLMQANVCHGGPSHDAVLSLAFEAGVDFVAIQEPWILNDLNRRTTKSHPAFITLSPVDAWTQRPRAVSYVRKGRQLRVSQLPGVSHDVVAVRVEGPHIRPTTIWNVYNAPVGASFGAGQGCQCLLQLDPGPNPVVVGDFNIRHPAWDASARSTPRAGEELLSWADSHCLRLLNPPGAPTHDRGGTLDLAFAVEAGSATRLAPELRTTSDHLPLLTKIPGGQCPRPRPLRLKVESCDVQRLQELLKHASQTATLDASEEAELLVRDITTALDGSTPRSKEGAHGAPWWTPACQTAHRVLRRARASGPSGDEKAHFKRTVRNAKRDYWRRAIEEADSLAEVYRITKWHKHAPNSRSPPLQTAEGLAVSPKAKMEVLRHNLLHRHLDTEDVPWTTPTVPRRHVPWPEITDKEVFNATCRVRSSAPGADEIPVKILREAWPTIGARVCRLFRSCLRQGVHPPVFKAAEVVILKKPGDKDLSLPDSYRPIALLSCLGKGLERLLARRISYLALRLGILGRDQCSAVSKRSATDLTTALVCDIQQAWKQKRVAGMVTLDVKGAFDSILGGRLLVRLREQGWPEELVRWTRSFCSDRAARIRLDGETSDSFPILCGLPQGSPISPILFLLFMAPALELGAGAGHFGYADDINLLRSAQTLEACRETLQRAVDQTLQWGADNGIDFSVAKTELQFFHRKRRFTEPSIQIGDVTIPPNDCTRWLGVFLDRQLKFRRHVQLAANRAKRVTDHVRRLCGVSYGIRPYLLRQAMQGCALATLFYGAETWYHAATPQYLIEKVQVAMNRAALAVVPAYRTTPIPALLREIAWAPARAWLDRIRDRLAVRVAAADPNHPLRQRWSSERMIWIRARQHVALSGDTSSPPWHRAHRQSLCSAIGAVGRATGAAEHQRWASTRGTMDLTVYSDGSLSDTGTAGAAFYLVRGPGEAPVSQGQIPLGYTSEVYDAEVTAATAGLRAALESPLARLAKNVTVCLDNEEAALRLHAGHTTATSYSELCEFQKLKTLWVSRDRGLYTSVGPGTVQVRWCPGHSGVAGNETADKLAKEACTLSPVTRTHLSIARAKRRVEQLYQEAAQRYWNDKAPARYRELGIGYSSKMPGVLALPRPILGHLLAARSGHGDFAAYHTRFKHDDALMTCSCGQEKSPEHFLSCPLASPRPRLPGRIPRSRRPQWLLGTDKGAAAFATWCESSAFFRRLCPSR